MKKVKVYRYRVDESLQSDPSPDFQVPIGATHDGDFVRSAIICTPSTATVDIIAADGVTHMARLLLYGSGPNMSIDIVSDLQYDVDVKEEGRMITSVQRAVLNPEKAIVTLTLQMKREGGRDAADKRGGEQDGS